MFQAANVSSIAAIDELRVGMCGFADEARQALSAVDMEVRRAVQYLCQELPIHWQMEIRRSGEAVNTAKLDLQKCLTFKAIGETKPACTEERKQLQKAQARLVFVEKKAHITRNWAMQITREVDEFDGKLSQIISMIDGDLPRAIAVLERMVIALENYLQAEAPEAQMEAGAAGESASMAQPIEKTAEIIEKTADVAPPGAATAARPTEEKIV